MSSPSVCIAVHGGAGVHSHSTEPKVKEVLKLACVEGLKHSAICQSPLEKGAHALECVQNAIVTLEDNPLLNAGYGSNLTLTGEVECDAAMIDGKSGDFGSVGAVSGVQNPIHLAYAILKHSRMPDPLGRIPPLTLVSEGARTFAAETAKLQSVPTSSLIAPRARKIWQKWRNRLQSVEQTRTDMNLYEVGMIQDTVGAVASVFPTEIAAGVSSGGILLKTPGRVGEAAIYGAGCWAQHFKQANIGIACSVSGTGEYIVRSMLARAVGEAFEKRILEGCEIDPHDIIVQVLLDRLLRPCQERGVVDPDVGLLLLTSEATEGKQNSARLWCAFTTASMSLAYASSWHPEPEAIIFRRPTGTSHNKDESRIFISAVSF